MLDEVLYKSKGVTGSFESDNPQGIMSGIDNWIEKGKQNAVESLLDWIPWGKILHFFVDLSVVVSLGFLIWYCYAVMIGTKEKREQCSQRIYISMLAVFVTKCLEVLTREK